MLSGDFPSTSIGLPSQLKYELPPSLPNDCRSYTVAVSPNGITQVVGQSFTNVFVANSAMALTPFVSQPISFDLPAGQGDEIFLDPRETVLSWRLTLTPTTATVAGANLFLYLISSAASFIESITLTHANTPIEQIMNYNLLHSMMLNSNLSISERQGAAAISMGMNATQQCGLALPHNTAANVPVYFNFSIPLMCLIGLNSTKLIPIGAIQSLQLQIQTATNLPFTSYCTAVPTTQPIFAAPVLDQFLLQMKYINIGQEASALMRQTLQDGKWFLKANTYVSSNSTVPAGSSGNLTQMFQVRNSSVKSLFFAHTMAGVPGVCPNQNYDCINPGVTQCQLSLGGQKFPQKALNPSLRPCETYYSFIQALGGGTDFKSYGGAMTRSNYGASTVVPTNSDSSIVVPAAGVRAESAFDATTVRVVQSPNQHYIGFDTERCTGSNLFGGINTRSSPPFLDLTIHTGGIPNVVQSYCWANVDVVYVVDLESNHIQAYN